MRGSLWTLGKETYNLEPCFFVSALRHWFYQIEICPAFQAIMTVLVQKSVKRGRGKRLEEEEMAILEDRRVTGEPQAQMEARADVRGVLLLTINDLVLVLRNFLFHLLGRKKIAVEKPSSENLISRRGTTA